MKEEKFEWDFGVRNFDSQGLPAPAVLPSTLPSQTLPQTLPLPSICTTAAVLPERLVCGDTCWVAVGMMLLVTVLWFMSGMIVVAQAQEQHPYHHPVIYNNSAQGESGAAEGAAWVTYVGATRAKSHDRVVGKDFVDHVIVVVVQSTVVDSFAPL